MNLDPGNLGWLAVLAISSLWLIGMGFSLATVKHPGMALSRRWVRCPIRERETEVEFLTVADAPYEVNRCAAFGDAEVTCGKECLPVVREGA